MTAATAATASVIPRLDLESGVTLAPVTLAYQLEGEINRAGDNVVLVLHALTGNPNPVGDWWREVTGPGRPIDTRRYAVLAPNLLGSCYGSTGPSQLDRPWPIVSPRDQARAVARLLDSFGVEAPALVTGGSLGGMVTLEWAALFPSRTRSAVVFAAPAAHTPYAVAWNHLQRRAVEIGGVEGLALARMMGMMTYRTEQEFGARFEDRFESVRYLQHQGQKLVARFDLRSYLALIDTMDAHDLGRARGGLAAAVRSLRGLGVTAVGIPGDLLYSAAVVRAWAEAAGARYREIHSVHGHDGFLIEQEQVARILVEALA